VFASNRFAILPDDADDEAVRIVPVVKKEEKPVSLPKEELKSVRKAESSDNRESRPKSEARSGDNNRRPRREDRGDDSNEGKEAAPGNSSPGENRFRGQQNRSGPSGDRQRRERENDATAGSRRAFDRRSGTGRGREEKRGGAGRGNWGSQNDEEKYSPNEDKLGDNITATAVAAVAEDDGWGPTPETPEVVEEVQPTPTHTAEVAVPEAPAKREPTAEELQYRAEREKEEKQMTLDEYLKTKKPVPLALPEARKAGEGEDSNQWGKFVVAGKSNKDPVQDEKVGGKQAVVKQDKKSSNSNKVLADANMLGFKSDAVARREKERRENRDRFRDQDRPDRSDRPDRPDRKAQAPASRAHAAKAVDFALEEDFPVLGAVKG